MKTIENGVLGKSDLYFASPSPTAQKLYYCPISCGHFYCVDGYHVVRENYNSLLIAHIIKGSFTFMVDGEERTANKGETVLLDCFKTHEYFTKTSFESIWIHINGLNCLDLYDEIVKAESNIIKSDDSRKMKTLMFDILNNIASEDKISEISISLDIYKIFTELSNPICVNSRVHASNRGSINEAKKYIADNLTEPLSVKKIASVINMSQSHFSRVFKQQTGFSPYEYVLVARLNKAKDYLQTTQLSITEIAYEVGFNSESNFIFFFTTNAGISPTKFRKLKF